MFVMSMTSYLRCSYFQSSVGSVVLACITRILLTRSKIRLMEMYTFLVQVSEYASWSGLFYFRIIQAALAAVGAPENLVDVITGYAYLSEVAYSARPSLYNIAALIEYLFILFFRFAETGEALVSSVDKMIFVGSPGVGKLVQFSLTYICLDLPLSKPHYSFIHYQSKYKFHAVYHTSTSRLENYKKNVIFFCVLYQRLYPCIVP